MAMGAKSARFRACSLFRFFFWGDRYVPEACQWRLVLVRPGGGGGKPKSLSELHCLGCESCLLGDQTDDVGFALAGNPSKPAVTPCLRIFILFPLLVSKETYHYWTYFSFWA